MTRAGCCGSGKASSHENSSPIVLWCIQNISTTHRPCNKVFIFSKAHEQLNQLVLVLLSQTWGLQGREEELSGNQMKLLELG